MVSPPPVTYKIKSEFTKKDTALHWMRFIPYCYKIIELEIILPKLKHRHTKQPIWNEEKWHNRTNCQNNSTK